MSTFIATHCAEMAFALSIFEKAITIDNMGLINAAEIK